MTLHRARALASAAVLAAALQIGTSGCESRVSLGARCDSTALCPAPLVCGVGGRCRVECLTSAECPIGERCLVDVSVGIAACSIERETCSTDCAAGLECVERECQSRCATDTECPDGECLPTGVCRAFASGLDAGPPPDAFAPDGDAPDDAAVDAFDPRGCAAAPAVLDVDVGLENACAITSDGTPYCWGYFAIVSAAGDGGPCAARTSCYPRPVVVAGVPHLSQITVGGTAACGISRDAATLGQVWCWGGSDATEFTPRAITDELGVAIHASAVDAGRSFACAITSEATPRVRCWGSRAHGALGDGLIDDGSVSPNAVVATELGTPADSEALRLGAYATFVRAGDTLRAVGQNDDSEIADPDSASVGTAATRDVGSPLVDLGITADNTCALVGTATLCWGRHGNLSAPSMEPPTCLSTARCTYEPTRFDMVPLVRITGDPYGDAVLGWNAEGAAYGWGSSFGEVLARPNVETIQPLTALRGAPVSELAIGDNSACAILRDGAELVCWGLNDDGQLGRGTVDADAHPVAEPPCW